MKPGLQVEVIGLPEVQRKLLAAGDIVRADMAALLEKTAHDGQARAQTVVPVATGALRNAITASPEGDLAWVVSVQGAPQAYAAYVEYGTRYVSARGYMRSGRELMRAALPKGSRELARKLPGEVARS